VPVSASASSHWQPPAEPSTWDFGDDDDDEEEEETEQEQQRVSVQPVKRSKTKKILICPVCAESSEDSS
jgi:hypothetical protein